jgi:hypothetical protein
MSFFPFEGCCVPACVVVGRQKSKMRNNSTLTFVLVEGGWRLKK